MSALTPAEEHPRCRREISCAECMAEDQFHDRYPGCNHFPISCEHDFQPVARPVWETSDRLEWRRCAHCGQLAGMKPGTWPA